MEHKWADTNAMANIATGISIFSLIPSLFGMTDSMAGCIPWMLCALPFVFLAVVGDYINKDIVSAVANSILTGVCLMVNLMNAIIAVIAENGLIPANAQMSLLLGSATANLGAGIFCAAVLFLAWGANKALSIALVLPTLGFILLFFMQMGIAGPFGILPGLCFSLFGVWMFYSGIAMLFHQATGKVLLPYFF